MSYRYFVSYAGTKTIPIMERLGKATDWIIRNDVCVIDFEINNLDDVRRLEAQLAIRFDLGDLHVLCFPHLLGTTP